MIYDLIIVGLGSHGSSCFRHFAGKMNVLAIEQYESPHQRGSHNGETRIVREMWYDEPEYIEMARKSLQMWQELQDSTSTQVYVKTGGLTFDRACDVQFNRKATELNSRLVPLDNAEVEKRYPIKSTPDQTNVFDANAGYVHPEIAIDMFIKEGLAKGGKIVNHCKYISHEYSNGITTVYTDQAVYKTKKLIISLGMGLNSIQGRYPGLRLELLKQQIVFFKCDMKSYSTMPVFLGEIDKILVYGFPPINGEIKIALHFYGANIGHPQIYDQATNTDGAIGFLRKFFKFYMPEMETAEVSRVQTCVYTVTPDHHFIIDFHPDSKDTIVISACSGHGFKFSILMGQIVDEMFETRQPKYKLFEFSRFLMPKL